MMETYQKNLSGDRKERDFRDRKFPYWHEKTGERSVCPQVSRPQVSVPGFSPQVSVPGFSPQVSVPNSELLVHVYELLACVLQEEPSS